MSEAQATLHHQPAFWDRDIMEFGRTGASCLFQRGNPGGRSLGDFSSSCPFARGALRACTLDSVRRQWWLGAGVDGESAEPSVRDQSSISRGPDQVVGRI
jgi:hypothetical protein